MANPVAPAGQSARLRAGLNLASFVEDAPAKQAIHLRNMAHAMMLDLGWEKVAARIATWLE